MRKEHGLSLDNKTRKQIDTLYMHPIKLDK